MRKKFLFIVAIGTLIMACNFLVPTQTPTTPEAADVPLTEAPASTGIAAKLAELGGALCHYFSAVEPF
ncbi:hypothetical protein JZU69_03075 [bacterium]|nr:hypothetical protein [bacterium]